MELEVKNFSSLLFDLKSLIPWVTYFSGFEVRNTDTLLRTKNYSGLEESEFLLS